MVVYLATRWQASSWRRGWRIFQFLLFYSRFPASECGERDTEFFSLSLSFSLPTLSTRLWTKLFVKVRRVFFNNTSPTLSLNALFHLGALERAKASLLSLHPRKLVFNASSARPAGSMNFSLSQGERSVFSPLLSFLLLVHLEMLPAIICSSSKRVTDAYFRSFPFVHDFNLLYNAAPIFSLTSCAGITHVREFFSPKCNIFSVLSICNTLWRILVFERCRPRQRYI